MEGRWAGLRGLLEGYEHDYKALNISVRSLPNLIHEMRDKCAHIKVGGNDSLGIVGLDGPDAKIVGTLVKLLGRIIANHLNKKGIGGLVFLHTPGDLKDSMPRKPAG